jgi:integrase
LESVTKQPATATAPYRATSAKCLKQICREAGIDEDWAPHELRHTFVSLAENDVPIEKIADLVGHASTRTTETVYRHQLRPAIQTAGHAMDHLML